MAISKPKSVRYPEKLWEKLANAARKSQRTIAGEIIYRLNESFKKLTP